MYGLSSPSHSEQHFPVRTFVSKTRKRHVDTLCLRVRWNRSGFIFLSFFLFRNLPQHATRCFTLFVRGQGVHEWSPRLSDQRNQSWKRGGRILFVHSLTTQPSDRMNSHVPNTERCGNQMQFWKQTSAEKGFPSTQPYFSLSRSGQRNAQNSKSGS